MLKSVLKNSEPVFDHCVISQWIIIINMFVFDTARKYGDGRRIGKRAYCWACIQCHRRQDSMYKINITAGNRCHRTILLDM